MKILHIINNLGSGGAEKLIEDSLPLMNKKERIKADILLLTDKNNVFDKGLKTNKVKVDVIPLRKPYNPKNIIYIKRYINNNKYDIVHAHLFPTIYWVSIASKLIFEDKPKFIMTEHSTYNRRREKNYLRFLEKIIYSRYDRIVSISQDTQNNLVSWLNLKNNKLDKFIVIENGINIDKFKNAIPYKKSEICNVFTNDTKLICMIGRFSKAKDQPTLIRAMQYLPKNVHLLLIGEGELMENNKRLAKEINVADKVHFLGYRSDVEKILKTVDIVALSSNWEGFGLSAIEGMAAGKPIVVSNVPGLSNIIHNGGLFFEKGNYKKFADIVYTILNDQEQYDKISNMSLKRANLFSVENMTDRYVELYKKL